MTRPTKPLPREPIRRIQTRPGVTAYRAVVDVAPKGAPRKQRTSTHATLQAARAWVTAQQATRGQPQPATTRRETVTELADRWLTRPDVRTVTREGNRHTLAGPLRRIGHLDVQQVTVRDVADMAGWLTREGGRRGGPLGPRSVRACIGAVAQVLDVAVGEGTIGSNPARSPAVRRPRQTRQPVAHWDVEQLRAFVAAGDLDRWAPLWRLVASGMTRADVCGLQWPDVDTDAGTVQVERGRVQLDHGSAVDAPKSTARRRTLDVEQLWPGSSAMLRALRATHAGAKLRGGSGWRGGDFVALQRGAPIRPQLLSERFAQVTRDAGLPGIRLHATRHTLAGLGHAIGITPADMAATLGHSVPVHLSAYLPASGTAGIATATGALGSALGRLAL